VERRFSTTLFPHGPIHENRLAQRWTIDDRSNPAFSTAARKTLAMVRDVGIAMQFSSAQRGLHATRFDS
jgi:hypothetical protein